MQPITNLDISATQIEHMMSVFFVGAAASDRGTACKLHEVANYTQSTHQIRTGKTSSLVFAGINNIQSNKQVTMQTKIKPFETFIVSAFLHRAFEK